VKKKHQAPRRKGKDGQPVWNSNRPEGLKTSSRRDGRKVSSLRKKDDERSKKSGPKEGCLYARQSLDGSSEIP